MKSKRSWMLWLVALSAFVVIAHNMVGIVNYIRSFLVYTQEIDATRTFQSGLDGAIHSNGTDLERNTTLNMATSAEPSPTTTTTNDPSLPCVYRFQTLVHDYHPSRYTFHLFGKSNNISIINHKATTTTTTTTTTNTGTRTHNSSLDSGMQLHLPRVGILYYPQNHPDGIGMHFTTNNMTLELQNELNMSSISIRDMSYLAYSSNISSNRMVDTSMTSEQQYTQPHTPTATRPIDRAMQTTDILVELTRNLGLAVPTSIPPCGTLLRILVNTIEQPVLVSNSDTNSTAPPVDSQYNSTGTISSHSTSCVHTLSDMIRVSIDEWLECKQRMEEELSRMSLQSKLNTTVTTQISIEIPARRHMCPVHENITFSSSNTTLTTINPLETIMQGPGIDAIVAGKPSNSSYAPCAYVRGFAYLHFPHAMQQLYLCFSWWHAHPHQQPLLVEDERIYTDQDRDMSFLKGYVPALANAFGVKAISSQDQYDASNLVQWKTRKGYQFHKPSDAAALRQGILSLFPWYHAKKTAMCTDPTGRRPTIGIITRGRTRSLLNLGTLVQHLQNLTLDDENGNIPLVNVVAFEGSTFEDQVRFMGHTDILITPHGAQLGGIAFLPPCAFILEIFPPGYFVPLYFGSLAEASGLSHAYLYIGKNRSAEIARGMATPRARGKVRGKQVCADVQKVADYVLTVFDRWRRCCRQSTV
jgi:hypothetical protein